MSVKKVGELLIEQKLISLEHLKEALDLQKVFPDLPIGQLLCKLGFVKESDLSLVLDQKNKRRKLSDILLQGEKISQQKLSHAREVSKQSNIPLEKALLKLHYVDEEQMAQAVASQYDLPYVLINDFDLDISLSHFISAVYAQKQRIVPISKIGNTLTLAMAGPLSNHVLRELEDSIRLRIIPAIATETSIYLALKRLYNIEIAASSISASDEVNLDIVPDSIDKLLSRTSVSEEPEVEEETKKRTVLLSSWSTKSCMTPI